MFNLLAQIAIVFFILLLGLVLLTSILIMLGVVKGIEIEHLEDDVKK